LFTIIVLGQAVIDVVSGAAATHWAPSSTAVAATGILLAGGLWWLYFDFLPTDTIGRGFGPQQAYTYSHAPLLAGIVAVGVGTRLAIAQAGIPRLSPPSLAVLCGGLAAYALAASATQVAGKRSWPDPPLTGRLALAFLAVATGLLGHWIPPTTVVALLASGCAGQVLLELSTGRSRVPRTAEVGEPNSCDRAASR